MSLFITVNSIYSFDHIQLLFFIRCVVYYECSRALVPVQWPLSPVYSKQLSVVLDLQSTIWTLRGWMEESPHLARPLEGRLLLPAHILHSWVGEVPFLTTHLPSSLQGPLGGWPAEVGSSWDGAVGKENLLYILCVPLNVALLYVLGILQDFSCIFLSFRCLLNVYKVSLLA